MPLYPQVKVLLNQMEAQGMPVFEDMGVSQAREMRPAFRDLQGDAEPVAEVRNVVVPGPAGSLPVPGVQPIAGHPAAAAGVFHDGGWVIGNVELQDNPGRALADAANCVLASVEYRLSSETKFPGPAEDCYMTTRWLAAHAHEFGADRDRLVLGGDSARGTWLLSCR